MNLEKFKRREILVPAIISLVAGLVFGAGVYHFSTGVSEGQVSEMVQSAFEAQGVDVNVASVEKESLVFIEL